MAKAKQHNSDLLLVLLLFFVYAICALMLCVVSVNTYSTIVSVQQEGYNQRTGILYIAQKVHQNDMGGGVRIDEYNAADALVLIEQTTGDAYETWIFIQDGYLCEQMIAAGSEIVPAQAQKIMPMLDMKLTQEAPNYLKLKLTTDTSTVQSMSLALRSSGEAYNATGDTPPRSSQNKESSAEQGGGVTIMTPAPSEGGAG